MPGSTVCETFPAPPATPALSAAGLDAAAAAAAAASKAGSTTPAAVAAAANAGDTIPLPPHVGAGAPLSLVSGALGGSPKSLRGGGPRGDGDSPLSRSPHRQALPPLPLKQLGRSISNPVISSSKPHQQRAGAGGAGGGLHGRGPLRKGKWTPEEEIYAHYIIDNFNKGLISLSRGTTLRSYLSDKLNCDPMRVTKKFSGTSCIGKSVFCPAEPTTQNIELIKVVARRLEELEHNFKHKVESHPPYGATAAAAHAAQQQQLKQLVQQHGLGGPLTPHPHLSKARYSPPPPPPPPPLLARASSTGSTGSRGAAIPPPPPQSAGTPPGCSRGSHHGAPKSAAPSPPRPPTLLPSRHSMPDLALAALGGEGEREYRRPGSLVAGGAAGHKRGRCEVEDLSLNDHDAGDLLVNFFASVHRNYSVGSLNDMEEANDPAAASSIPRHRAPPAALGVPPSAASPLLAHHPSTPLASAAGDRAGSSGSFQQQLPNPPPQAGGLSSVTSSPSEATFAPEPSPTASPPLRGKAAMPEWGVSGPCKEEAAEAEGAPGVGTASPAKRPKVAIDGC